MWDYLMVCNSPFHFLQEYQEHSLLGNSNSRPWLSNSNSQNISIGLSLVSQTTLRREDDAWLAGCVFHKRNTLGVATNVYLRKNVGKTEGKPVKKRILSSGVVFTLEEGISTSHVCLEGQQPLIGGANMTLIFVCSLVCVYTFIFFLFFFAVDKGVSLCSYVFLNLRWENQTYVVLSYQVILFYLSGDHFKALDLKNDPFQNPIFVDELD